MHDVATASHCLIPSVVAQEVTLDEFNLGA